MGDKEQSAGQGGKGEKKVRKTRLVDLDFMAELPYVIENA